MTYDPMRPATPAPSDPSAAGPQDSPWSRPDQAGAAPSAPIQPDQAATQPVQTGPVGAGAAVAPAASDARPPAPTAKRRSSGRWLNAVLAIAAAVAIGGVAFAVGRGTASASTTNQTAGGFPNGNGRPFGSFTPGANGGGGFGRGGGLGGGGLTVSGTVESVTADSITIKTANGQTITVGTGADTTYHTSSPASASDVTTGKTVQVQVGFAGGFGGGGNGNGGGNGGNGGGANGPRASGAPAGPVGTANSVTVLP